MTAAEIITIIAAATAAIGSIAASVIGVLNAINQQKTHVLVDGMQTRSTQLERATAQREGFDMGLVAQAVKPEGSGPEPH